jgi:hypothetical protein
MDEKLVTASDTALCPSLRSDDDKNEETSHCMTRYGSERKTMFAAPAKRSGFALSRLRCFQEQATEIRCFGSLMGKAPPVAEHESDKKL